MSAPQKEATQQANSAPIGIFDSGLGGLTVARTIMDQLPNEAIHYIGDTARGPYGPLPIAQVRAYAMDIADQLVASGAKMLVIACNTASAAFLRDARERYEVPVVEVIHPAVRRAMATTRSGRVGVIGTTGTINSGAYQDLFSINPGIKVFAQACPDFVDFVEKGITSGPEVLAVAREYLAPLVAAEVDTLVLGCTHYPLISGVIQLAIGDSVTLVSSAEEATKDVLRALSEKQMLAPHKGQAPIREFVTTGDPETFADLASRFLGPGASEVYSHGHTQ
ncbi:glutamate racemase [Corynebacterium caspium]|uniref:glutamate racemase n=1 Tax=Corynebacterium caspium TaxID=234828 RepID=UPI00035C7655|nr:glutamate racemase [Corynebacterium caspium]WKD58794.1 Glutamate racemase [Corynebacterium caspium DSM 44850]